MSENVEFGWLNIVLGAILSMQIFGFICRTLYEFFPDLGLILIISQICVLIFTMVVMWREMR